MKKYSLSEVKQHNQAHDCWLVIDGKVYDVTEMIETHSGGKDKIVPVCGTDATIYFQTQGGNGSHSLGAQQKLNDFLIGELS